MFDAQALSHEDADVRLNTLGIKMQTSNVNQTKADMEQMASDEFDEQRTAAADGLGSAASKLDSQADRLADGGAAAARGAHKVADAIGSTADYIRTNGMKDMAGDVRDLVKRNPGPALLAATLLGFVIARSFSRN